MKNYVSTENSLKRFLKRKVKITMGFVVAFMIMGTVGFAKTIVEGTYDEKIHGDGELVITGGTFSNKIYGGSNSQNLENTNINLDGKDIIFNSNGRIFAGGENKGVSNELKLNISNFKSTAYKTQIVGGSEVSGENLSVIDGNSLIHITDSEIQADIRGGGFSTGKGTSLIAGNSKVIIENTSVSGFSDNSNNTWTGRIFGAGLVQGGDLFKQNSSEMIINNVTGVTYNKDEDGQISNYDGTRVYGGGQSFNPALSGKNSVLTVGSAKVTIDGEKTALDEVYGGSIISGTGNKGVVETGKTEIIINNGKIVSNVVGGNNTNWNGHSVIGTESENGQYEYNGKKYNAGSTNITINSGDLSTANVIGGSFSGYAWYYESKDNVIHDSIVFGNTNVTVNGGKVGRIIGGGYTDYYSNTANTNNVEVAPVLSNMIGDTNIVITGGEIDTIIGGGFAYSNQDVKSNSDIKGNTNITVLGGTITGNIYGGGYADESEGGKKESISAIVDGNSTITISGGEIQGKVFAGGETENAKVTGEAKVVIDVDDFKAAGIYSGYAENSILELTENVKTFDTSLIEKETIKTFNLLAENDTNKGFDKFIVHGETEITGGLNNITELNTVENANAILVDNIENPNVDFQIDDVSKVTIRTKNNIVSDINGTGTLVIDTEVKNNELVANGGIKIEGTLEETVKIGATTTTDDLVGQDITEALNNLNDSVTSANKNNTVEISEGKLFGKATATGTNVGIENIKTETKSNTVMGIEDLATINYLSWKQEMNSLSQRMGELRDSSAEHGVWARIYGGKVENGSQYDNEYQTYQVGYDKKYTIDNGKVYLGYLVSYTDGETNYNLGHGENYSVGAGIYATWMNNNGYYVDVLYKVSRLNNKFDVNGSNGLNSKGEYDTYGISLSTEYGKRFDIADKWFAEPSIGMYLGRLGNEIYTTNSGIEVEQDSIYTAEGRIGTAIGYKFNDKGNIYARTHVVKEFAGDVDTKYNTGVAVLNTSEDMGDTWFEFGIGANYRFTENMNVYVDVQKTGDSTVDTKWQGNLGFRYEF